MLVLNDPPSRCAKLQGKGMQVDPNKPTLKAPKTKRLKLRNDQPPSFFALKFDLHRYPKGAQNIQENRRMVLWLENGRGYIEDIDSNTAWSTQLDFRVNVMA